MSDAPLVSVVTPFYNTADYLAECIESVLAQTLDDFEYVLADNASTDGSLEIAEDYARRDDRIRVIHFDELIPQIPNYNRALREADSRARFCKMAQADDVLLPRCLEEMVRLAESDPEIALVGAYTILQDQVFLDGLDFYESVVDGTEFCGRYLKDGPYIFGSPTTHMYRMEDVKARANFYPEDAPFADVDVTTELVIGRKFGFVHQVLSFVRTSNESISSGLTQFDVDALTRRLILEKYGRRILDGNGFRHWQRKLFWRHHRVLGKALVVGRPDEFWELHKRDTRGVFPVRWWAMLLGAIIFIIRGFANLEATIRGVWGRFRDNESEGRGA